VEKRKKVLLLILAALAAVALLLGVAGALLWHWMGRPLYQPGALASGEGLATPLDPPAQEEPQLLRVAPAVALHSFSDGSGSLALVLHGGPGQPWSEPWEGLHLLAGQRRFLYYHQRGCGLSTRPIDRFQGRSFYDNVQQLDAQLGLAEQVADVERIRRILGQEHLVLVGHSFGAFLAALYAAEFPDRVRGLVLVSPANTVVFPQDDGGLFERIREQLPADQQAAFRDYQDRLFDMGSIFDRSDAELAALNGELGPYYAAAARARGVQVPVRALQTEGPGGWMVQGMYLGLGRRHDYSQALGALQAPVLVVHGQLDLQPEACSRLYLDYFPEARLEVIPGVGHFSFIEAPEAFAAVVGPFLQELE